MISVQGFKIQTTSFPDNTSQVWNLPENLLKNKHLDIEWKFENEAEFIHLAQLQTLLHSLDIKTSLNLPYLPYARQDKGVSNKNTFALTTFAKMLNSLNFTQVKCLDVHSETANRLIQNLEVTYPNDMLSIALKYCNSNVICYPDKGAAQKYSKLIDTAYTSLPCVYGDKIRNQASGQITSYALSGNVVGSNVMIVDDIIDGGATFIKLAEILYENGAKNVGLFATHGIFSRGRKVLRDAHINDIFVANDLSKEDL